MFSSRLALCSLVEAVNFVIAGRLVNAVFAFPVAKGQSMLSAVAPAVYPRLESDRHFKAGPAVRAVD